MTILPIKEPTGRKKIFLHIGLPKTGTSYIQSIFESGREFFRRSGVYYPRSGSHPLFHDTGQHLLAIALMIDRWEELQLQISIDDVQESWGQLETELQMVECKNILISSEWFAFDVHHPDHLRKIKSFFCNYDVYIVLVLRDIVDFVSSVYAQRVRDGFGGTVVDYIALAWENLNWRTVGRRWANIFGEDHIVYLDYEDLRKHGLLKSFTTILFNEPLTPEPAPTDKVFSNFSLSPAATQMLREINNSNLREETKIETRDRVKDIYNEMRGKSTNGFLSPDAENILRRFCVWPEAIHRTKL